jgi:hypothetical protein
MSSSAADGSEDVSDFLQRIKELGDRRDQEDEERNRKLEEEILQGRKERQARRAGKLILFRGLVSIADVLVDVSLTIEFRTRQINFSHKVLSGEYSNIFHGTCHTTKQPIPGLNSSSGSATDRRTR